MSISSASEDASIRSSTESGTLRRVAIVSLIAAAVVTFLRAAKGIAEPTEGGEEVPDYLRRDVGLPEREPVNRDWWHYK